MNKKILKGSIILFLSLIICIHANAQNEVTDSTATTVPYWVKGDNQVLSLTKTIKKFKKGKLEETYKAKYKVDVMVLEESDSHYLIEWKYSDVQITGKGVQLRIMDDLYEGLRIEYKTDEFGTFIGITNYEEVVKRLEHSSDSVIESYKSKHTQVAEIAAQIKALIRTKHGVETITLRDIQMYHGVHGYEVKLNEVIRFDRLV